MRSATVRLFAAPLAEARTRAVLCGLATCADVSPSKVRFWARISPHRIAGHGRTRPVADKLATLEPVLPKFYPYASPGFDLLLHVTIS
jgi:hypothetical protein